MVFAIQNVSIQVSSKLTITASGRMLNEHRMLSEHRILASSTQASNASGTSEKFDILFKK